METMLASVMNRGAYLEAQLAKIKAAKKANPMKAHGQGQDACGQEAR